MIILYLINTHCKHNAPLVHVKMYFISRTKKMLMIQSVFDSYKLMDWF